MVGLNMKTISLILLLAVTHAVRTETSRSKQKIGSGNTEKRKLEEGNAIEKRTPVLATASPSLTTGIEYADTKEALPDKSPSQQAYPSPGPQIAKISDVLTGQGPFQAAIANHLYSPVSVYQQRGPLPTYEIGAPVPSQLAYSEHRVSIPNIIQYNQKPVQPTKQNLFYDQPQGIDPGHIQQIFQQIPNNHFFLSKYNPSIEFPQQKYQQIVGPQSGIIYPNQQNGQGYQQINQGDLKSQPVPAQTLQKQNVQAFNPKSQNALSYATFIYNPVDSTYGQQHPQQIQLHQPQIQQQQIQEYIQPQYQQQVQPQQVQIQHQPQIQYQLQHPLQQQYSDSHQRPAQYQQELQQQQFVFQPPQFQPQQQLQIQAQQYDLNPPSKSFQREATLKQGPNSKQFTESYQQSQIQNIGHSGIPVPTFPPVQYFGKIAPSIYKNYQQQ